jgi:hypothetical protein
VTRAGRQREDGHTSVFSGPVDPSYGSGNEIGAVIRRLNRDGTRGRYDILSSPCQHRQVNRLAPVRNCVFSQNSSLNARPPAILEAVREGYECIICVNPVKKKLRYN